jgi:hypothetical protein
MNSMQPNSPVYTGIQATSRSKPLGAIENDSLSAEGEERAVIAPNTVLGNRYKVTRPLGGGGMKQVYLAADSIPRSLRCWLCRRLLLPAKAARTAVYRRRTRTSARLQATDAGAFDGDRRDDRATG